MATERIKLSFLDTGEIIDMIESIYLNKKPKDDKESKIPEKGDEKNEETPTETFFRMLGIKTGKDAYALHNGIVNEEVKPYGRGYPSVIREIYRIMHNNVDPEKEVINFIHSSISDIIENLNGSGKKLEAALRSVEITTKDKWDELIEDLGGTFVSEEEKNSRVKNAMSDSSLSAEIKISEEKLSDYESALSLMPFNWGKDITGWSEIVSQFIYGGFELESEYLDALQVEQSKREKEIVKAAEDSLKVTIEDVSSTDVSFCKILAALIVLFGGHVGSKRHFEFDRDFSTISGKKMYYCDSCKFNKYMVLDDKGFAYSNYCVHPSAGIRIIRKGLTTSLNNERHIPNPSNSYCSIDFAEDKDAETVKTDDFEGLTAGWSIFDDDKDSKHQIKITEIPVIGSITVYTDTKNICNVIEEEIKGVEKLLNKVYNSEERTKGEAEGKSQAIKKAEGQVPSQEKTKK